MFLQPLDLTTALRPELFPDETLLYVQDAVGLYEGKYKLPEQQNGHAYLTSHRVCYVDNVDPRGPGNSVALELKTVERYEFYAGFVKSSAKITLFPKPSKRSSFQGRSPRTLDSNSLPPSPLRSTTASPAPRSSSPFTGVAGPSKPQTITWICPICSFSNILPHGFDVTTANANTPLPQCQACGIKPALIHVLKAAIAGATNRPLLGPAGAAQQPPSNPAAGARSLPAQSLLENGMSSSILAMKVPLRCPRCTFENHPSLLSCEICGAALVSDFDLRGGAEAPAQRPESPGPSLGNDTSVSFDGQEAIKLSFRAGGEKVFYERLMGAMVQRKWLLVNAPHLSTLQQRMMDEDSGSAPGSGTATPDNRAVGIAGLERLGLAKSKINEAVISNAFEDLEALMGSAKEIIALAESMSHRSSDLTTDSVLHESIEALGMTATKDVLGSRGSSDMLYLSELARTLAEYLTDDRRGILRKEGGIMSLVNLYATFNRANSGGDLVSPADFAKAAELWAKLGLPIRLRTFKNGLHVVQGSERTDEKTVAQMIAWLSEFHVTKPPGEVHWDWRAFGKGVTAQEVAARFGWSVGVATEELEMAEERGALCREDSIEGLKFWENWLLTGNKDEDDGLISSMDATHM